MRVRMRRMTTTVPKGSAVEELYATATKLRKVQTTKRGPRKRK
jgi:hypothetical protein